MKKIKIGYIISHLENCGPVNILYGIIKYLDRNRFEPYIITLKPEKKNTREADFKELGLLIEKNKMTNFNIILKKNKKLIKRIEKLDLDILHAHCIPSSIILSNIKNKKIKKIITVHCDLKRELKEKLGVIIGNIFFKIYIRKLKKMDRIIACGKGLKDILYKGTKIKISYIQNGIDIEKINLKNITQTRKELKLKWNIEENKKIFIVVGRLDENKNILYLAKIFKESIKNVILIIVGDGEKREELEEIIKDKKNILYVGKREAKELQELLYISDYYISASKSEGMPNTVLEALQFKLYLILSDIPPHEEIIEKLNYRGIIFKLNDEKDLKEKIEKLLSQEKIEEIEESLIEDIVSANKMAKNYIEIYNEVLNK